MNHGRRYFYHADGLGSVVALTDQRGNIIQTFQYDSFGKLKDQKSRIKQAFSYTGREWDKETGLYYYRARYYEPAEGRFISRDPIGFAGGINLYRYVNNNPTNLTDPLGLKDCCVRAELAEIQRNLAEVKSALAQLRAGILPGGKFGAEELGKTTCWLGGFPTWRTSNTRGGCVKECLEEHEATHGFQCVDKGYWKYNNLSRSEEIAYETAGYQAQLDCLERKLRGCK